MFYTVKTPWWLRQWHRSALWTLPVTQKILYLSFDDGPHPQATPFVLSCLAQYRARATFFCIGKNVAAHADLYRSVLAAGHAVGNHTYDHLNGWKSEADQYAANIDRAGELIASPLFRPPYGRISRKQSRALLKRRPPMQLVMWDVLSGDFDLHLQPDKCADNVKRNAGPGSIVVFHDSAKALPRLEKALPDILKYFHEQGYSFESIPYNEIV